MAKKFTWVDPTNLKANHIEVLYTDGGGDPDTQYGGNVNMGVQELAVANEETDLPEGRKFAARGVNTDTDPDTAGPLSNVYLVPGGDAYFTDFSTYTTGAQPSDWTLRNNAETGDFTVEEDAAYVGGKALVYSRVTATNAFRALSWDTPGTMGAPIDTYAEIIIDAGNSNNRVLVFGSDSPYNEYGLYLRQESGNYRIFRRVDGDAVPIGTDTIPLTLTVGQRYKCRMKVEPDAANLRNVLSCKVWLATDPEPAYHANGENIYDTELYGSVGWAGVFGFDDATVVYDVLGVGLNGTAAPETP